MKDQKCDIVIAGLSGSGIIMSSRILSTALRADGNHVLCTETPGTTHRYGLVFAQIRSSRKELGSPYIGHGDADLLIAFEPLEGLRLGAFYVGNSTAVVLNDRIIKIVHDQAPWRPPLRKQFLSLEEIMSYFRELGVKTVQVIPATKAAEEVGNVNAVNMVMLGAGLAGGKMNLKLETLEKVISELSPKAARERNIEALRRGKELGLQALQA